MRFFPFFGLLAAGLLAAPAALAQTGIGTSAPDVSAALDVVSSSKGALLPRMTETERGGITSPATGLIVFQTDGTSGYYYNAGTPATPDWQQIATAAGAAITATNGLTKTGNAVGLGGTLTGPTTVDLGVNNLNFTSTTGKVGIGTSIPSEKLHVEAGNIYIHGEGQGLIVDEGVNKRAGLVKYPGKPTGLWRADGLAMAIGRVQGVSALPGSPTGFLEDILISPTGTVRLNSLVGASTRLVVTNAAGDLSSGSAFNGLSLTGGNVQLGGSLATPTNIFAGSNFFSITGTANVGIGTSTPTQKLEVTGTVFSSSGGFRFPDNTVQTTAATTTPATTASNGLTKTSNNITLGGTLTGATTIDQASFALGFTNGNVGIGISTPTARLHVVGNARITGLGNGTSTRLVTVDANGNLVAATAIPAGTGDNLGNHTATQNLDLNGQRIVGQGGTLGLSITSTGSVAVDNHFGVVSGGLTVLAGGADITGQTHMKGLTLINTTGSSNTLIAGGSNTGTVMIGHPFGITTFEGNVGLGTPTPTEALEVAGTVFSTGGGYKFPDNTIQTTAATTTPTGTASNGLTKTGNDIALGGTLTAATVVHQNGFPLGLSDGHVGIGKSNPTSRLDIVGNETTMNGTGAAITLRNLQGSGGNQWHIRAGGTGTGTISGGLSIGGDTTYVLGLTPSGRVGIGTTLPTATFHVAGNTSTVRLEGLGNGLSQQLVTVDGVGNLGSASAASFDVTTASNGLTRTGNDFVLGGALTGPTTIGTAVGSNLTVNGAGAVNLGTGTGNVNVGNPTGTTAITGTTNINISGTAATSLGNGSGTLTLSGPTNINANGAAPTNIGTGAAADPVTIGRPGGTVTLGNLTGASTRLVTADASGNLSTQSVASVGDNLGNHTATADLNLGTNKLIGTGNVSVGSDLNLNNLKLVGNGGTTGLSISNGGAVTSDKSLTVATGGLTVSAGGATVTGITNINTTGTAATTIGNTTSPSSVTIRGATNINTTVPATTTIGTVSGLTTITGSTQISGTTAINGGTATGGTDIGTSATAATVAIGHTGSTVTMHNLAGSGSRMVVADGLGILSATTTGSANGLFWGLSGNAGTTAGTHFLGTTDAQDVVVKASGTERLRVKSTNGALWTTMTSTTNTALGDGTAGVLTTGTESTFLGFGAGAATTTGTRNTFTGSSSGLNNTFGSDNTFTGQISGLFNSTGSRNTFTGAASGRNNGAASDNTYTGYRSGFAATGSHNTFTGSNTGFVNTTGARNTFTGSSSGLANTTGEQNVFVGASAGAANTTASNNVFVGDSAGTANSTGTGNVFVGNAAGKANTGVGGNTFLGHNSGRANTTGSDNIFTGTLSGAANTTGGQNVFVGSQAGRSNTIASNNAFVGDSAGFANTTGAANVFVGNAAGKANTFASGNTFVGSNSGKTTTTGSSNTFSGEGSGADNSTGFDNTFTGRSSGSANTDGNSNTFTGRSSGLNNTTGDNNTFTGLSSGLTNSIGADNTFTGRSSGFSNSTGSDNTFTGSFSGFATTTGGGNVFVGNRAGRSNTTASGNAFVGDSAGFATTTGAGNVFVGNAAGKANLTASGNTFVGHNSGKTTTTGFDNTFSGATSGQANTDGHSNTFAGRSSGLNNTTGDNNTFTGLSSGLTNTTGADNTFTGRSSGFNSSGSSNTFTGNLSGFNNTTGTDNTALGNNAGPSSGALTNATAIGADARVSASNSLVLGGTSTNAVKVGIGMTAPQTALDVLGALALRDDGTTATVTADNQVITVGNRGYIRLASDNATANSRTIFLSDGLVRGQLLIVQYGTTISAGLFQIADNVGISNTDTAGVHDFGTGDTIMLIWNGAAWFELSYTDS